MVKINTNLSSLIVQRNLVKSTNALNQAIERMTTGFKINHAADNAANYSIANSIQSQLSSYDIAANNVAMGSDLASTATDTLDLVSGHLQRIRDLMEQSANGTYGEDSRKAIQAEVDSRLDDINRIINNCEYNNIRLFNSGILPSSAAMKLVDFGMNAGTLGVNVDGVDYTVNLTNDDTLFSMMTKLESIGVSSSFDDETGMFTAQINAEDITDNGTGFKDIFGIVDTDGYKTDELETDVEQTSEHTAILSTRLNSVGITDGNFTIVNQDGVETNDSISITSTIQELFNKLETTYGISGTLDDSGVIKLETNNNNYIKGALANQLGIQYQEVDTTTRAGMATNTTNSLTYTTTYTATGVNKLSELGIAVGDTIEIRNNAGNVIWSATADSAFLNTSLDGLFDTLESNGIDSAVISDGVISFTSAANNYVTGTIATKMGIDVETSGSASTSAISQTSSNAVTYAENQIAGVNNTFSQMGVATNSAVEVFDSNGAKLGEFNMTQSSTLGDFIGAINGLTSNGNATVNNGVISISNGYVTGDIATAFGLAVNDNSTTTTIAKTQTSTAAITFNTNQLADTSNTFAQMGVATNSAVEVFDSTGTKLGEFNMTQSSTLGDFIGAINGLTSDGNATVNNGIISISSGYVTGDIATAFELTVNDNSTTTTAAKTQTSSAKVTYTTTSVAVGATTFTQLGITATNKAVSVYNEYGTLMGSFTVANSSTLTNFLSSINAINTSANATLTNGVISIASGYITGDIANAMEIGYDISENQISKFDIEIDSIDLTGLTTYTTNGVTYTVVGTAADLQNALSANEDVILSNDINLTGIDWNIVNGYSKNFDGNGHVISNLNISTDQKYAGLFGSIASGATISNLGLENATIISESTSSEYTGVLAGFTVYANIITNCYVSDSSVTKNGNYYSHIGGLVGQTHYSTLSNINLYNTSITSNVSNWQTFAGGIVGFMGYSTINSANTYNITVSSRYNRDSYVGGLVGEITNSSRVNNINIYNATVSSYTGCVGGLTGALTLNGGTSPYISNCNINADISSNSSKAGKFVGDSSQNYNNTTILDSCTSDISMTSPINDVGNVSANYYAIKLPGTYYITIHKSSTNSDVTVTTSSTMSLDTFLSNLKSASRALNFTLGDGSIFQFTQTSSDYIVGMSEELKDFLHLDNFQSSPGTYMSSSPIVVTEGLNSTSDTIVTPQSIIDKASMNNIIYYNATDSKQLKGSKSNNFSTNTKLSHLGLSSASFTMNDGTVVNIASGDTIVSKLQNAGLTATVSSGKITIKGDSSHYITAMDSALATKLKISVGENYTWEAQINPSYSSSDSSSINATILNSMTNSTTLGQLGIDSSKTFTMNGGNVITIGTGDSIVSKLQNAGLGVSITNGQLTITGDSSHYITAMDSALTTALKIQAGKNYTWQAQINPNYSSSNSSSINATVQYSLTNSTTLGQLNLSNESFVMNNNTTISISSTDSIVSKLQSAGLSVNTNNGQITIVGNSTHYIKDMSSGLKNALKINAGEGYTYTITGEATHSNTNSATQSVSATTTLTTANSNALTMSNLGLGSNGTITTNNYVVTVNTTDLMSDVLTKLGNAGIGASINDSNGTLSLIGSANDYITSVSTNLKNLLGLNAGDGYTYNSTTVTTRSDSNSRAQNYTHTTTVTQTATENTLLSSFDTESYSTAGNLVFLTDDGFKTVSISSTDSIKSFRQKLSKEGIVSDFADGKLTISANNGSISMVDYGPKTTSRVADLLGLNYNAVLDNYSMSNDINVLADEKYAESVNVPSELTIQVGISGNDSDKISIDTNLALGRVTFDTITAESAREGLAKIDKIMAAVTSKQSDYASFSNRLDSASESIITAMQNLTSSLSTIRDADIAKESSAYIKAQILQQAAATLLATANQTPSIALQLL